MNLPKQITVDELSLLLSKADKNLPDTFPFHITIDDKDYICGIGCPEKTTDVLEGFLPNGFWTYIMSLDDSKFVHIEMEGMLTELQHKESLKKFSNVDENSTIFLTSHPTVNGLDVDEDGNPFYQVIIEEDINENLLDFWKMCRDY